MEQNEQLDFFQTSGLSMWPFLKEKEKLIVKKLPFAELRTGDLILYRDKSLVVCHRLLRKIKQRDGEILLVRADASLSAPETVGEAKFVGKVIGVVRNNQTISFMGIRQTIINRLILLISPLISLLLKIYKMSNK